jgi:predicted alpha/beta-fold hydrolase
MLIILQCNYCRSPPAVLRTLTARGSYTRQLVMTSDHGTLGLDWYSGSDKATWAAHDAPIVLFIHGINGETCH